MRLCTLMIQIQRVLAEFLACAIETCVIKNETVYKISITLHELHKVKCIICALPKPPPDIRM